MLKKSLLASAVMLFAVNAYADDAVTSKDYYVRADASYAFSQEQTVAKKLVKALSGSANYNQAFGGQVGFGAYLPNNFRVDLTVGFLEASVKGKGVVISKVSVKSIPVMFNAYYDIADVNGFTPYVMAGAGFVKNNTKLQVAALNRSGSMSGPKSDFGWNAGAGVAYNLTNEVAIDLGYKYSDLGKTAKSKAKLSVHQALLGLRYSF
jgi:opacity protein-like surface antigen